MRLLATREHSHAELRRKLTQKGFAEDEVEPLLALLVAERLLSDERFTECFVESRRQRGSGPVKIRLELQQNQIDPDLISRYLDPRDPIWLEAAARVREKKFGEALPDDFKERMRQSRFLEYRGFSHEHIRRVMREDELVA